MIEKIKELKIFVLLKEKNINKEKNKGAIKKTETKTQRRKMISSQKSVLNSASNLFDKSGVIIDEFMNNITWRFRKRCSSERSSRTRSKYSRKN